MGIGEPFDNFDNVMQFLKIINDDNGTADTSDDAYKTLGKIELNYNTWTETWNDNKVQSGEGYNFNTSGNDWLGGANISGDGWAFVHAGGFVIERELGPGESLRVDTGCIAAFEETVDYDIRMVKGFKSMLFGGEGMFLAYLKGPGKVWLQTMPFSRLARRIGGAIGSGQGETRRGGLSMLGDMLGGD